MSNDDLGDDLSQELDEDDVVPCSPGAAETSLPPPWTLLKGLHQNGHQSGANLGDLGEKGIGMGAMGDSIVPHTPVDKGVAGVSLPLDFMEEDDGQDQTLVPTTAGNTADVLLPMVIPPPVHFANSPVAHSDLQVGDDTLGGGNQMDASEFVHMKGTNGHPGQRDMGPLQGNDPTDADVANIASSASLLSELNKNALERYGRETDKVLSSSAQREEEMFPDTQGDIFDSQVVEDALSASTAEMIPILQVSQDQEPVLESESLHLRLSLSTPADLSDPHPVISEALKPHVTAEKPHLEDSDTDLDDSVQILDERPKRKSVEIISIDTPKRVRVQDDTNSQSQMAGMEGTDDLRLNYTPTQSTQCVSVDAEAKKEEAANSTMLLYEEKKVDASISLGEGDITGLEDTGELHRSNSGGAFIRNSTPNPPLQPETPTTSKTNPNDAHNNAKQPESTTESKSESQHISPIEPVARSPKQSADHSHMNQSATPSQEESDISVDLLAKDKSKEESDVSKADTEVLSVEGKRRPGIGGRVLVEFSIRTVEEDGGAVLCSYENVRRNVSRETALAAIREFERRLDVVSPGGYSADVSSASKSTSSSSKGRHSLTSIGSDDIMFELPRSRLRPAALAKNSPVGRQRMRRPATFAKMPRLNLAVNNSSTESPAELSKSPQKAEQKRLSSVEEKHETTPVSKRETTPVSKREMMTSSSSTPGGSGMAKAKVVEKAPEKTEETVEVQQIELETQWRPLAPGIQVFAKWQDHYFYPGRINEQGKQDMWNVDFSDGKFGAIRDSNIVPVEVLKRQQLVYALLQEEEYVPGYIISHRRKGNELLYEVALEDKTKRLLPRQRLALNKEQAQFVRDSAFPASPSFSSRLVDVSLENVVQGKRKRVVPKTPVTPVQSRLDPNIDLSDRSESEPSASKGKGRGKGKSGSIGKRTPRGVQPLQQPSPAAMSGVGRGKRKRLEMSEGESSGTPPSTRKKKGSVPPEEVPSPPRRESTRIDEQTMGPLPKSKIFAGKAFMVSKGENIPHPWEGPGGATTTVTSDSEAFSQHSVENKDAPFARSYVCRQLVAGGGTVFEAFEDLQAWSKGERILISNTHSTSVRYLRCLAAGFPPVNYKWVIDCCVHNRLVAYKRNLLPCGWSMEDKCLAEWRSNSKGIMEGLRVLAVSGNTQGFCQVWKQVLLSANARRVDVQPSHTVKEAHLDNVDMVLSDESCPVHLLAATRKRKIPAVTSVWVIQSLVQGKQVLIESDNRYSLSVNSDSN